MEVQQEIMIPNFIYGTRILVLGSNDTLQKERQEETNNITKKGWTTENGYKHIIKKRST